MSINPKTIQIFLPDGDPNSIKVATIRTRNIEVVYFSRNNLENLYKIMVNRNKVGIYFLFGINENNDQEEVYVGEAEDVVVRLGQHNKNKDFWQKGYFVIDNNGLLTKSHIKYLENLSYNKIKEAEKIVLNNETEPTKSHVDETIEADLNGDIFESIELLLSLLIGDNIFEKIEKKSNKKYGEIFICKDSKGSYAEGKYLENGFLVFKDSKIRSEPVKSFYNKNEYKLRTKLINDSILVKKEDYYIFSRDYLFSSPSTAASIAMSRLANGWTEWKTKDGKTLDDIYRKDKEEK